MLRGGTDPTERRTNPNLRRMIVLTLSHPTVTHTDQSVEGEAAGESTGSKAMGVRSGGGSVKLKFHGKEARILN